ncbi:MAG: hypothetical protein ACPKPY_10915 [Nitrososphaeraceae archaeon]
MNKSIILTSILVVILLPGMLLGMPGISVLNFNIHLQNSYADSYGYDNYRYTGYGYDNYGYGYDNYGYGYDDYGYGYDNYRYTGYGYDNYGYKYANYVHENNDYDKSYETNTKEQQYSDYKYADYKKEKQQPTKNFAEIESFDDKLFVCDN